MHTTPSHLIPTPIKALMTLAIVLGIAFIWPYLGVVLISAVIAFAFNPLYQWLLKHMKRSGLALALTVVIACIIVIIPVALISFVTINQVGSVASRVSSGDINVNTAQIDEFVDENINAINDVLRKVPSSPQINEATITNTLTNAGKNMLSNLSSTVTSIGSSLVGMVASVILALFLIVAMLQHQNELFKFLRRISPFDDSINNLYLEKAADMTKAMIVGQFVIAIVQGLASAGSLWIVGIDYFWFFVLILSFLSFIPLGAGIVTIPIGIVMAFTGDIWQGIFVVLFHILVVSNIDNFIRPRLVPKTARLNTALTLLAVFSGISLFGAPGVIYGPVVMILIMTTFIVYRDYNHRESRPGLLAKSKHALHVDEPKTSAKAAE